MPISLSGLYEGTDARDYLLLQDDLETRDGESVVRVRVMRQRDEDVQSGTILVRDDTFQKLGPDDAARSSAISRALIWWLQDRPALMSFTLRVDAIPDAAGHLRVKLQGEERQ